MLKFVLNVTTSVVKDSVWASSVYMACAGDTNDALAEKISFN